MPGFGRHGVPNHKMVKLLSIVLLAATAIVPVRSMAQTTDGPAEPAVAASIDDNAPIAAVGDALNGGETAAPQEKKERIPFSELPLSEQIKQITAFTCFCIVLALYLLRRKIGIWVEGKPVWIRAIWGTLCFIGRYFVRPILIMMKWMILLPLLILCKMFKLGGKAAWISAKLTGKAALTVAKEVRITGGVFGEPGGGSSASSSYERDARREAERQRRAEAERQEKSDKTPMSATVNSNGQVIAKNRFGKTLFGVTPNGKNATAHVSDGCLVVNSTASNGTGYIQIWDMNGKMIRTEAQPK